jgi:PAS domain-containing protein
MDWEPIASHLTQGHRPALLVDGAGRVRFLNASMEKLLGRRLDELSTTRWLASCVSPAGASGVRQLLGAGFRGEATTGDVPLVTREGRRVTMQAELSREVRGRSRALVVIAQGIREVEPTSAPAGDCWCEVSRDASGAGVITSLRFLDPQRRSAALPRCAG